MKYLKIFTDFLDAMALLTDEEAGRLFRAMLRYAADGTDPKLTGNERYLWVVAKQHIDREAAAYESMVNARREAGRRSGEVRRKQTGTTTNKSNQDKDKEKDKEKDKDKDKEREYRGFAPVSAAVAASRALSMPPSLEEIEAYCGERGNQVNPQRFLDFYTANGWRIGKVPMKDWKAAVRSWETNGMDEKMVPAKAELTDKEIFQQAIEIHRMKEAKQI